MCIDTRTRLCKTQAEGYNALNYEDNLLQKLVRMCKVINVWAEREDIFNLSLNNVACIAQDEEGRDWLHGIQTEGYHEVKTTNPVRPKEPT
jgi:hypothetical protein